MSRFHIPLDTAFQATTDVTGGGGGGGATPPSAATPPNEMAEAASQRARHAAYTASRAAQAAQYASQQAQMATNSAQNAVAQVSYLMNNPDLRSAALDGVLSDGLSSSPVLLSLCICKAHGHSTLSLHKRSCNPRAPLDTPTVGLMGQTQNVEEGAPPITPPEVEVNRRRKDYLHRLGIQKDHEKFAGYQPPVPPTATAEAPDRLQHPEESGEKEGEDFEMNALDLKSQDDFRVNFLRKLSYSQVWVPQAQKSPQHQTVIIFDWDDTLLCTSFLNLRQEHGLSHAVERCLKEIESASKKLLQLAQRMGHTFIITNAMSGWVEYSAAKWAPGMLDVLQRIRVISARTKFEPEFPGEVGKWKENAFLEVQKQLDNEIITNLISVGDSNFEMDALHVMGKQFAQALVKTIKFRENPSPEELLKQLELVTQKFEKIVENARNLKIGLERKWVGNPHAA
ncbi:unnamed protein product [Symbiodinium necroappetens]|uniref:Uncharacterized protein n=1 Tax=Symbiodinium necroappetens TaxID=1628268 RepID=A0A812Z1Q1_9DINO|nr:unnamed protein product [Symbiodinium necroappetens]